MINIHFNFRLDVPIVLNKFSIFDRKSSKSYIDYEKTSNDIIKAVANISKANKFLLKLSKGKSKFSLTLPGYAVEYLSKEDKSVIDDFAEILKQENTEILASTYYNSFCHNYSSSEFKDQIKQEMNYIEAHFKKKVETFITHFSPRTKEFYETLNEIGLSQVYVSGYNGFEDIKDHNEIFTLNNENMNLIFRHHDLSIDLNDNFFDKEFRNADMTPSNYISWLKKINSECSGISNDHIINITVEFETLFSEKFREFAKELFDRINVDSEVVTVIPRDFKNMNKKEIKDSSAIEMSKVILTEMQIDSLDKLYALENKVELLADEDLLFDWRILQNLYFVRDFSQNSKFIYQPNHENHYELYVSYMNIIEDLNRRITNKIKDDKIHIKMINH